ncbi:hypothetical protein KEM54_004090, partial [Ascosphaera aggregata]
MSIAKYAAELLSIWHESRAIALCLAVVVVAYIGLASKRSPDIQAPAPDDGQVPADKRLPKSVIVKENTTVSPVDNSTRLPPPSADDEKKRINTPKRVHGTKPCRRSKDTRNDDLTGGLQLQPMVFYLSLTATTEIRAKYICERLQSASSRQESTSIADTTGRGKLLPPQLHDLSYIDFDDYFIKPPEPKSKNVCYFYLIIIPSYNIDTVLSNFLIHLSETHHDFRIDTAPLSSLAGYSVFGFGDREGWPTEDEGFCCQAKEVDIWMAKLTGRRRAFPLGMGDVKGDWEIRMEEWYDGVVDIMGDIIDGKGLGQGVPGSGDPIESDDGDDAEYDDEGSENSTAQVADVEDIGDGSNNVSEQAAIPIDFTTYGKSANRATEPVVVKEMVPTTSPTYAA